MSLRFSPSGLLPPGEHAVTLAEVAAQFGSTISRRDIFLGITLAATSLAVAGCRRLWVDGSFVTEKEAPRDWDGCWDAAGVHAHLLDPVLLDFTDAGRHRMKTKYRADLFPASCVEKSSGLTFVEFFKVDKNTGTPKGILLIDLRRGIS